ncbi:IS200/IS605 family accessory protein TnpB-related protein [Aetokthonos hydrillicola Thurmond2011]|jgi:IS605 OrfB family transposase|uniref:IS200/IS605 family accessory protein TnpB-related protein n=3 Tax=Aetokthonos TaxID=1550243 RepID=A0AAP5I5J0_9CYAN|nr:IS200/IS605 family accessory protein TnpB-related protein [Aetokthonos hydrillicola]MBW4583870.1 IS200/IS605 family accessory protein TnpB-related protein [Aetokthonos hydrillicola CCALA 1050]MDR9895433.1 IS200/IS605 family accessory protein TnpB-related protein [Aetokthonos hydrillicola Thurmond2011]
MPSITAQTRLDGASAQFIAFLDAMATKFGVVERTSYAAINRGEKINAAFENELQQGFGLSSQDVRNAITKAEGNYKSQKELIGDYISQTKNAISSIKGTIKKLSEKLKKLQEQGKKKPSKLKAEQKLKFSLHQKQRKLATKEALLLRLKEIEESGKFSVAFGSKKLFKSQFNLEANGYSTHAEWLADWREKRSNHIFYVGANRFASGNLLCRLTAEGQLTISVPPCLQEQFGTHVTATGVFFRYGQDYINAALTPKRFESTSKKTLKVSSRIGTVAPLTHLLIRKDGQWYLHTTVELPEVPLQSHRKNGVLGVDFNPTSADWAVCDSQGNLKASGIIALNIQDKSTDATKDAIGKLSAQLVRIAESFEVPICIEKLDFFKKKASLKEKSKKYARMLSNFAYSSFAKMLEARCQKIGIELIKVEPAFSSVQGLTKFMAMYGLNSGVAAALVLARRALRKSERLPRALHVALKKPVDSFRHVWKAWSEVSKVLNTRGRKNRHVFYTSREEEANSLMQVTLKSLANNYKGKGRAKKQGVSHLQVKSLSLNASG